MDAAALDAGQHLVARAATAKAVPRAPTVMSAETATGTAQCEKAIAPKAKALARLANLTTAVRVKMRRARRANLNHACRATTRLARHVAMTTTFNLAPMRIWAPKAVSTPLATKPKVADNANPIPHAPALTS